MSRLALALLATAACVPVARAADDPRLIPGANDSRLRAVEYSDRKMIRLTSTDLVPITITYGEGEKPTLIAGIKVVSITAPEGTTDPKVVQALAAACTDWCADRHGNELTLQPLKEDVGSMLAVTTEKDVDGVIVHHRYRYELRTRAGAAVERKVNGRIVKDDPEAYFAVQYTYRAEEAARRAANWRAAHGNDAEGGQRKLVSDRLAVAPYSAPRNYKWTMNDSPACRALAPDRMSDDGRETVLHFRMNTPVSQPNLVGPDGKTESEAAFHTDKAPDSGLVMTLHSAPARFVLRRGDLACGLVNQGYDPNATAPNTGTSSPEVIRETRR